MADFTRWLNENNDQKIVVNMKDLQDGANDALTERERPWFSRNA